MSPSEARSLSRVCVVALAAAVGLLACSTSHQEDVCANIGACSQAGDTDWIKSCEDEADALMSDARAASCTGLLDSYFDCADSSFTCTGITASFPGCDGARSALEACFDKAVAATACGQLAEKTKACATPSTEPPALPPACTLARDCAAKCYLDAVGNACAPTVAELDSVASCSRSCPP
ncbi:MAG: hypothetical protein JWM74_4331 [Myxococcaceae bacterium]|nr:hypothetical protein [Myxococcaceae bacterium]